MGVYQMRRLKFGLEIFQNVEVVFAVIIILAIIVFKILGWEPYAVQTGSMEPSIHTGALVFVDTNVNPDTIKEQDIIAYKLGNENGSDDEKEIRVTHRVVEVHSDYFVTKGDANPTTDPKLVFKNQMIGKIKFDISYLGKFAASMNKVLAIIIIGSVVILNIIISIIINRINKRFPDEEPVKS